MKIVGKRALAICLLCLILVLASGCGILTASPKTFTDSGLTVTLTNRFSKTQVENFTVAYDSKDVAVLAVKETFSDIGSTFDTLREYAELVLDVNGLTDSQIIEENGLTYFVYENKSTVDQEDYTYLAATYQGSDAYWLINFACKKADYNELKDTLLQYAASVKVA